MSKTAIYRSRTVASHSLASRPMRYAASLTGVLILTGCAIGKSEFTCSGIPEGVSCLSASEVYEASKHTDGPVTGNPENQDQPEQERQGAADPGPRPLAMVPEIIDGALPLRTPSRVMRIWIAPWEAEDSDLHLTKLIYTEIEPRRWTIGKTARAPVREITPHAAIGADRASPAIGHPASGTSVGRQEHQSEQPGGGHERASRIRHETRRHARHPHTLTLEPPS